MLSEVRHWISDHGDQINLLKIKITGTLLTVLTVFGYVESVSKFDHLLNIHIIVVSIILLMITLTGYSVYVYTVMTDITGDATLLNHLYMVLAIIEQIRAALIFYMVIAETLSMTENSSYYVVNNYLYFTTNYLVWTIASIACITLVKHKRPESYLEMSQKSARILMTILATQLILTLSVFLSSVLFEEEPKPSLIMISVVLASFCILSKVSEDNYGFFKKGKKTIRSMLGNNNAVSPGSDVIVSQVRCRCFVTLFVSHNSKTDRLCLIKAP